MPARRYPERRTRDHPRFPLKNKFEDAINDQIAEHEQPAYERFKIPYTTASAYVPDFVLMNGIIIEVKGYFDAEDRTKLLTVRKQHPALDIRLILANHRQKLNGGSAATAAQWADRHGIRYAKDRIPLSWFHEEPDKEALEELEAMRK